MHGLPTIKRLNDEAAHGLKERWDKLFDSADSAELESLIHWAEKELGEAEKRAATMRALLSRLRPLHKAAFTDANNRAERLIARRKGGK